MALCEICRSLLNRLGKEKSPYLQQHAKNPVDWYPWGEEAFAAAVAQNKPIFLSIGYATCHWCHVMEHESFNNPAVAKLLNDTFISIKVDREERPDVDSVYMEMGQALMGGSAGWPLNLILTPELKPFFAVTYLPPQSQKGVMGFVELLQHLKTIWESDEKTLIVDQANKLTEMFAHTSNATGHELPQMTDVEQGAARLLETADPVHGGLQGAPKFPLGYQADFLLSFAKTKDDSRSLFYVELTLDKMCRGGIYDQIGGGFARYAIDEEWLIPHFEKMLYDNAILSCTYLEAWKMTKKEPYAVISREILQYIIRDMTHPEGGFFSGEDADSDGHEGLYYTWSVEEVEEVIPGEEGEVAMAFFDVTHAGNFEGRNVLNTEVAPAEFAASFNLPLDVFQKALKGWKEALLRRRQARPRPFRDEKIISFHNGLMIHAMIQAGKALGEPRFVSAALQAAEFMRKNLWSEGKLLHRWCDNEVKYSATLEDYAGLIKGVLSLFEAGCGMQYLDWAVAMTRVVERDFKEIEGAFYQTDGKESLILRKCDFYDGAEPSGNGVHTENLLRLYQITHDESFLRQAEDVLKAAKPYLEAMPVGACYHLSNALRYFDPLTPTVIVVLNAEDRYKKELEEALARHFSPHRVVIWKKEGDKQLEPDKTTLGGETALYICRQNHCEAPVTKIEEMLKAIEKL
ncbi:MAG: thioredoxin domain-containing protein [Verrucomicrobia bacterium]|nr:thioredoxin domain-containing protein [Verrucomicrobiota bacterium]